jgi:hypothetical protein
MQPEFVISRLHTGILYPLVVDYYEGDQFRANLIGRSSLALLPSDGPFHHQNSVFELCISTRVLIVINTDCLLANQKRALIQSRT